MDITLHIGAHRTGTTFFQSYVRNSRDELSAQGVDFWGPLRTRRGMLSGFYQQLSYRSKRVGPDPAVSFDVQLQRTREADVSHLLVSEENMMGYIGKNVRSGILYPDVGTRIACFANGFGSDVKTILITIRSLDVFWCSSLAFAVANDKVVPNRDMYSKIARSRRSWRDVITEVSRAVPHAEVRVAPFEVFSSRPDQLLFGVVGVKGVSCVDRKPMNASPDLPALRRALHKNGKDPMLLPLGTGRWNPFDAEQHSTLRELYADDMMWLTTGADGLAKLIEDGGVTQAEDNPPYAATEKGQFDEFEERRVARPG